MDKRHVFALGSGLALGMAGMTYAASEAELQAKVAALEARLAQVESQQGDTWLSARRAEEVKTLVREVLADADTRASLQGGGMMAGYDGKTYFLASDDGTFRLNIGGQIQVRYIANLTTSRDDDEGGDELGFEIRRAKLMLSGHIADPRIRYALTLANAPDEQFPQNVGDIGIAEAVLSYDLADGVTLYAGQTKAPFLREEIINSSHQLAVERSLVNEIFTLGSVQGLGVIVDVGDAVKINGMFMDGYRSGEIGGADKLSFDKDVSDFAVVGRVDLKLAGEWSQANDFTSWGGEPMAAFIGGAIAYQGDEDDGNSQLWGWTVDASLESEGLSLYGAIVGAHIQSGGSTDLYGAVVQAAYNINNEFEPFIRYEYIYLDDVGEDDLNLLTFGVNWYHHKHNAKFTLDAVWALNEIDEDIFDDAGVEGRLTGLLPSGKDNQVVVRAQYQLLF